MSDGRTWGTVIGGVVGFFTGGVGWAAGAAIGGAVGGLLEPKQKTETNRIDDITVSVSKYGDGIPETFGNGRPPLTWIWSTYVIEIGEEQSSGKGGGVENTNYRQFIHGTLCFGKTPVDETSTILLRKLWIDGKLNYDASSGLSPAQALATEENPWQQLFLLPGYADQLPWAIMEAWEGVGNVPAFRGRITAPVFGLECPGGRIPQLQGEICINASFSSTTSTLFEFDETFLKTVSVFNDPSLVEMLYGPDWTNSYDQFTVEFWNISLDGTRTVMSRFTADSNRPPATGHSDETAFVNTINPAGTTLHYYNKNGDKHLFELAAATSSDYLSYAKKGNVFAVAARSGGTFIGPRIYAFDSGLLLADLAVSSYVGALELTDTYLYVMRNSVLERWSLATYSYLSDVCVVPNYIPTSAAMHVVSDDEIYILDAANQIVFRVETNGTLAPQFEGVEPFDAAYGGNLHVRGNTLLQSGPSETEPELRFVVRGLSTQEADVADYIETQSLRAGLTPDQFDVSEIDESFWGLTNKTPASARANITPVMTYSAIGVVEEDGLLRYFQRKDKASVVTIPYEDLGFAEDGSEPGDPFPLTRTNAQELPRSITVTYNDYNFDYQLSTAKAMRYAVDSVLDENITLDINTNGDRAASIARRMLFERWLAQITRTLAVSRAYAYLSAGDVITVLSKDGSYGDWMTSKITDTGARIEIECFPADSDLLIQTVPGPGGFRAQQIEPAAPPSRLQILDIPILRDADDSAGPYVAIDDFGSGWGGAELFVGYDDTSLLSRGFVTDDAPIGFAETVLADWNSNTVDETNLFTVNIGNDVFESVTRDALLSGNGEFWAYGAPGRWEIGASASGDSLGDGQFILSTHLRGLFGTEQYAGTHEANDIFVLLRSVGMLRPSTGVGDIGQNMSYRAVSKGRSFNSASSTVYANTGEGLVPLSPVNLRRTDTNDRTVDRRSRLSMNYSTGTLPLGEATEAYSWAFYSSGFAAVLATIVTNAPTVTAAQMTAAGLTPSTAYDTEIRQLSDSVGAGHELRATA